MIIDTNLYTDDDLRFYGKLLSDYLRPNFKGEWYSTRKNKDVR